VGVVWAKPTQIIWKYNYLCRRSVGLANTNAWKFWYEIFVSKHISEPASNLRTYIHTHFKQSNISGYSFI